MGRYYVGCVRGKVLVVVEIVCSAGERIVLNVHIIYAKFILVESRSYARSSAPPKGTQPKAGLVPLPGGRI